MPALCAWMHPFYSLIFIIFILHIHTVAAFDVNTVDIPKKLIDKLLEQKWQTLTVDDLKQARDFIATAWKAEDTGHFLQDEPEDIDTKLKALGTTPAIKINLHNNEYHIAYTNEFPFSGFKERQGSSRKRAVESTSCGLGRELFTTEPQDVCSGATCNVIQVVCGSDVIDLDLSASLYSVEWEQCLVTKMECYESDFTRRTYDLLAQFNATGCSATGFFCDATQTIGSCSAEVACSDFTSYGYFGFALKCQNDKLYCDGQEVQQAQYAQKNDSIAAGHCSVSSETCTSETDACSRLTMVCNDRTTGLSGCAPQRMEVACSDPFSFYSACTISQVMCGGEVYGTNSSTSLRSCSIHEIMCQGTPFSFNGATQCMPDTLNCGGILVDPLQYDGDISACVVQKQVSCSTGTGCTAYQLTCEQAPVCIFNSSSCDTQCTRQVNTSVCICPDDYVGSGCAIKRDLNCTLNPIDNKPVTCLTGPSSDPKDHLLDGDRKCNVFSSNQQATMGYYLNCKFASEPTANTSFDYWLDTPDLRLSVPAEWTLLYKIFNFVRLSDSGMTTTIPLTREQIMGMEPVWFNTTFSAVPDRFWFGRRLYAEVSFETATAPAPYGKQISLLRQFLDVTDKPIKIYGKRTLAAWQIALIVIGVVIGVTGAVVGFVFYWRKKHPKPKKTTKYQ